MFATKPTTITKTYQDIEVHFRAEDGWVNATKLTKAFNRSMHHFWQIPHMKEAQTDKTRTETSNKGTWLHPTLAHTCAIWLDKDFGKWLALNRPRVEDTPTPNSYVTLRTFRQLTGREIDQPTSNRLSDKAKELTLNAGLEVKRPKEAVVSANGTPYNVKANAYPLKFWHEARSLLKA